MIEIILLLIASYLLGSIPGGILIGKLFYKTDIREHGSGNSGASNAWRVLGWKAGVGAFLIDFLKGTLAFSLPAIFNVAIPGIIFGVLAIIGHVYPIFAGFKGGKAVATSAGVAFAYSPLFLFINFPVIFFIVLYLTSTISISSIVAITTALIFSFFLNDWLFVLFVFLIWLFIIYRHKDNIKRIKDGTESKVSWGLGSKNK